MTFTEFISHNLRSGDKARLVLSTCSDETKEVIAFFKGFRIIFGQNISDVNNLYPVFCKMTKNGKISRQHTDEYTGLYNIVSIENLNEKPLLAISEIRGLMNASAVTADGCKKLVINILKELNDLFPGKWLGLYDNSFNAAFWEEHSGIASGINARPLRIRYTTDEGKDAFELEVDCDTYEETVLSTKDKLEYRPLDLLYSVVHAITIPFNVIVPFYDDDDNKDFINLVGLGHKRIPRATDKQPVLLQMYLLEEARYNLWWYQLTPRQQTKVFDGEVEPDMVRAKWGEISTAEKGYFYQSWMEKHPHHN